MVLPKSMRLKGHRCFDHIYKHGFRYHESSVLLRVVNSDPRFHKAKHKQTKFKSLKCAIAISNKVNKKAVVRNQLRRQIHAHLAMRFYENTDHSDKWALFSLKPKASNKSPAELLKECDRLLQKAGLM